MRQSNGRRICIICEGYEEEEYFKTLVGKAIFSPAYIFLLVNSKSINTISARYQEKYQSNSYDLVLVFCDTDKVPYIKYKELKKKINEFHGKNVADKIIIFGNPCTLQIILLHFDYIKLTSQSKNVNAKYIEKYTGIQNYKATQEQRKELFLKIKRDNYEIMKKNLESLSIDDKVVSSTNILYFFEKFESDEENFIDKINNKL
jgi:hypothetical protein